MQPTFNLIDQPWIGAVDHEGRLQEYSLRDLLLQAHELRSLHDDSPLVIAALLRVILALLHRVYDGPRNRGEWQKIWQAGRFDAERIDRYFAEWRERFELFGSGHRFYQSPEPLEEKGTAPLVVLLYVFGAGGNATLFDHTSADPEVELTPAVAARLLLTVHLYGFCGRVSGPAYFSDGPSVRDVLFFAEGDSLFETLVLNLLEYNAERPIHQNGDDRPAWEMDDPYQPARQVPFGYLDYLTWQDRRIRLIAKPTLAGIRVSEMVLLPGLSLDTGFINQDPMKHFRVDEKRGYISLRFQENRALWRDSVALLKFNSENYRPPAVFAWLDLLVERGILDRSKTLRCMALGMATEAGKQFIDFYRSEYLPLPLAYLDNPDLVPTLETALTAAEHVASELWKATGTLARWLLVLDEESERQPNAEDVRDLRATMAAERRYWARLEPQFRQTMQAIPQDAAAAMTTWFDWLRQSAWDVFNQVCDGLGDDPRALKAVVRGREQLARGLGAVLKIEL
ncbi:MAG: type I-E CRISPR-associated protein Cse1/CasA [Chloroflexi bacterium]|nr:MAG: type I-E CRISPR-associated protein Cse1/CasA [Chloroflexota bacterium]